MTWPYLKPTKPHAHDPVRDITENDLLTWEMQLKREGTLPFEVQRALLEHLKLRPIQVPA